MASAAQMYIFDLKYHLDKEYTYLIPENVNISKGDFALVPFGKSNKTTIALCSSLIDYDGDTTLLKTIRSTISPEFSLDEKLFSLVEFLKEYTFCTISDAVKKVIPCDGLNKAIEYYVITNKEYAEPKHGKLYTVYSYIKENESVETSIFKKNSPISNAQTYLNQLEKLSYIKRDVILKEQAHSIKEIYAKINNIVDFNSNITKRTPKEYFEIYERVKSSSIIPINELQSEGFSRNHIKAMEKKGFISFEEFEKLRIPYLNYVPEKRDFKLSNEQLVAFDKLKALSDSNKSSAALLYGVTGSGKSNVILELCKHVTQKGKTAIVLVPEIALTWQSVELFMQYYGKKLAVIHSALSNGERFDAYKRIKRGDVQIVLGTRSAIFAPLNNIGLIVIDEEQEHTYKSEMTPKYSAHDVARFRTKNDNALLVLSSATPSVESFYRAQKNIYTLIELKNRYGDVSLPKTKISDLRTSLKQNGRKLIGKDLEDLLIHNYDNCKQSLLLLNRRGYNSSVICHKCGETVMCPNCSVALTYHKGKLGSILMCHYCGYTSNTYKCCPKCGSEHISNKGYGTQMLEEELQNVLPKATILRMDADTVKGKYSRDEIVSSFSKGEADVLIGTQMIAKGHNFPYVTLAASVNIDALLSSNDFRANERTFDLLTQLEGRSGRKEKDGIALIQTFKPDNELIYLAGKQDYRKFYDKEIILRRNFVFPPFCDIAIISFISNFEDNLDEVSLDCKNKLLELISKEENVPMKIYGPMENPIYKLKNQYIKRIVIKHKFNSYSRKVFSQLMSYESEHQKDVNVLIDINPTQT